MKFRKKTYKKRQHHVTDWCGCGSREIYIQTCTRLGLNVDGSKPESEVNKKEVILHG